MRRLAARVRQVRQRLGDRRVYVPNLAADARPVAREVVVEQTCDWLIDVPHEAGENVGVEVLDPPALAFLGRIEPTGTDAVPPAHVGFEMWQR